MQAPFASFVVGVVFLLTSSGDGQDRGQSDPRQVDAATLEKRVAELEGKLSALGKEVEEMRRELRVQSAVAVVPLRNIDAEEAVEVIQEVYVNHPGVEVAALARSKFVIVQADKKTKEETVDLLHKVDVPSQGKEVVEKQFFKLKKAANGRASANHLIFSEDVERAMLMDAVAPASLR